MKNRGTMPSYGYAGKCNEVTYLTPLGQDALRLARAIAYAHILRRVGNETVARELVTGGEEDFEQQLLVATEWRENRVLALSQEDPHSKKAKRAAALEADIIAFALLPSFSGNLAAALLDVREPELNQMVTRGENWMMKKVDLPYRAALTAHAELHSGGAG
jgi:hypothetical protein